MKGLRPIWIVTDLDGTLMDHAYDFSPALDTLSVLKKSKIPVIPCTSKTASEVRTLRKKIGLHDPFIVENGGAIYGNKENSLDEWNVILGKSFNDLRPKLELISSQLGYKLEPLHELSFEKIESLTGLSQESIPQAIAREWSVPFLTPPLAFLDDLYRLSKIHETNIYQGNRMSHLVCQSSHKGKAVLELKNFLNQPDAIVIALGDSPNDIPLLEVAEKAIVVPSQKGPNSCFLKGIKEGKYLLAPHPHAKGWSSAVMDLLDKF